MLEDTVAVPVYVGTHPLLRILASFPIAAFIGALFTDLAYYATSNMMWADFSAWLLFGGMAFGVLAAIVGLVDLIRLYRARAPRPSPAVILGSLLVLAVAFVNNLIHSRDAWTSVVPWGIALSALTVLLIAITARLGARLTLPRNAVAYAGVR